MTVRNFMRRHNLFYISPQTTFGELQDILTEEPHSSYPLIDNPGEGGRVIVGREGGRRGCWWEGRRGCWWQGEEGGKGIRRAQLRYEGREVEIESV